MEALEAEIRSCERSAGQHKSFFIKRLEQHLTERGISIPGPIFALFDTPFTDFTPESREMYEREIKGQALFHIFSDMLIEIYEGLTADRIGWEAAANYLEDTPMKVCALHALQRIGQLEQMKDEDYLYMVEEFSNRSKARVTPVDQKFNVRSYSSAGKSHR
jgi:hypothetical protein